MYKVVHIRNCAFCFQCLLVAVAYLIFFTEPVFSQTLKKPKYRTFVITGFLDGANKRTVYLKYQTDSSGLVLDSSKVINGKFQFKGLLSEPTFAELSTSQMFSGFTLQDATLFIEPGVMRVIGTLDSLRFIRVRGSKSQHEYEKLQQNRKPIWLKLHQLQDSLEARQSKGIKDGIKEMCQQEKEFYRLLAQADSQYIMRHPGTYVAAYLLKKNLDVERFAIYPVDALYNQMPPEIQQTSYGQSIQWHMDKVAKLPTGSVAPSLMGIDLEGKQFTLDSLTRNKFVLVDFWASWCVPCRQLTPILVRFYQDYHQKGLEIVSIALNDKPENWKKAIDKDGSGLWYHVRGDQALAEHYQAKWLPAMFLIDRDGKIAGRYALSKGYGEHDIWELSQQLKRLFE